MDLTCDEEMLSVSVSPGGQQDQVHDCGGGDEDSAGSELAPIRGGHYNVTINHSEGLGQQEMVHYASVEPILLSDTRVLQNMLKSEEHNLPSFCYFKMVQTDITPEMRGSVSTWMFEVCEEEHVPESVFLRAITYVDRFLSVHNIRRTNFQLLGAACLLISSKWSGSLLSTERLVFYTAHSVTANMILEWEMMILNQFKWDMFSITPSDFVEPILQKLPQKHLWDSQDVRDKIKTYNAYCATDYKFCIHPPSMIASASIASAIQSSVSLKTHEEILNQIHHLTAIETDVLKSCMEQLQSRIQEIMQENSQVPGANPGVDEEMTEDSMSSGANKLGELEQAETPTDVRDVHF